MLRILFSRLGQPYVGSVECVLVQRADGDGGRRCDQGAQGSQEVLHHRRRHVPRCEGMGTVADIDLTEISTRTLSFNRGAIKVPGITRGRLVRPHLRRRGLLDPDKPIKEYTETETSTSSIARSRPRSRSTA
jgi:hypothetical protein